MRRQTATTMIMYIREMIIQFIAVLAPIKYLNNKRRNNRRKIQFFLTGNKYPGSSHSQNFILFRWHEILLFYSKKFIFILHFPLLLQLLFSFSSMHFKLKVMNENNQVDFNKAIDKFFGKYLSGNP